MQPEQILGRYQVQAALGEGGFATVFLAWDQKLGRRVAIKRVTNDGSALSKSVAAEARAAAFLNHPHIVQVYDFEMPYIVMEAVDGPNLDDYLLTLDDLMDLDAIAAVMQDASAAIAFAHENGVLHLDIKPANLLLARSGRIKVADFGMALLSAGGAIQGSVVQDFAAGGTIGYMPYEQLQGLPVGPESDQWALASLCYFLLTSENPFECADLARAKHATMGSISRPSLLRPELDQVADTVLARALDTMPERRYPSVGDFWRELAPCLGDPKAGRRAIKERLTETDG
ncbi:MAG: serine/threonine protein kinase [Coriobacteriales bacterium]|nr:serine/threonine protein kinase [Coriobacteriales bacterium]